MDKSSSWQGHDNSTAFLAKFLHKPHENSFFAASESCKHEKLGLKMVTSVSGASDFFSSRDSDIMSLLQVGSSVRRCV